MWNRVCKQIRSFLKLMPSLADKSCLEENLMSDNPLIIVTFSLENLTREFFGSRKQRIQNQLAKFI
jgi:hypothetical protein